MEKLKDFFYDNKTVIIILLSLILILLTNALQYYYFKNNIKDEVHDEIIFKEKEYEPEYIYVDIRGQVKKPGVYKISKDKRVIDAISISGGLTRDADTSVNNLSMRLNDEMVIIISSNEEQSDKSIWHENTILPSIEKDPSITFSSKSPSLHMVVMDFPLVILVPAFINAFEVSMTNFAISFTFFEP